MLGESQILMIRETWDRVMKRSSSFEATFTKILFELEPRMREIYFGERLEHRLPAVRLFDYVVQNIQSMDEAARRLKEKYSCQGVTWECTQKLSIAFLLAIEKSLRPIWNEQVRDTWAYFISMLMNSARRRTSVKENDKVHL